MYEPVHTTGGLHHAGASDGGDDDVDDVGGWVARFHAEAEYEYGESDARYGAESQGAVARAYIEGQKHYEELKDH